MSQFRSYFRHGNIFGDLRSFPVGAAPPVDPHSWSAESAGDVPLEPLQSIPLIQRPPGDDSEQEEDPKHIPQLTIYPHTRRNGLQGVGRALAVFNLTTGLGLFFLLFLSLHQVKFKSVMHEGAFIVDESRPGRLTALAIASTTSHLIFITGPIFMSFLAFRVANLWIKEQTTKHERDRMQPTVLQYGLLVRVLGSFSPFSIYQAIVYALRSQSYRLPSTEYYRLAIVTATTVYFLMHAAGAADLWLHVATRSIPINSTVPLTQNTYAVALNKSLCPGGIVSSGGIVCQSHPDTWGTQSLRTTGQLIAAGMTGPNGVSVINLGGTRTAVVVPSNVDPMHTFQSQTFAARTNCTSLNALCVTSNLGVIESCANAGFPVIPTADPRAVLGQTPASYVLGQVGNDTIGKFVEERGYARVIDNPARLVLQLRWSSQMNINTVQPNPAVSVFPVPEISIYAVCDLAVLNGTLAFTGGNYNFTREVRQDDGVLSMIWSPLIWQLATPQLVMNIRAPAMAATTADQVMDILGQQVSRLALATAGGLFERVTAQGAFETQTHQLTRYPLGPVIIFSIVLFAYGTIVLAVFLASAMDSSFIIIIPDEISGDGTNTRSASDLLRMRLSDPLSVVATLYPGRDDRGVVEEDALVATSVKGRASDMISESPTRPRDSLYVGLGKWDRMGLPAFGIWRWGQMYRYTDW